MSTKLITDTFKQVKNTSAEKRQYIKPEDSKTFIENVKESRDEKRDYKQKSEDNDFGILRNFDLEAEYGPCIGMRRLERWERANNFGLNPPKDVKRIIEENIHDDRYLECVWHDYNI
ncbi:DNA polymerase delta subunit 4-like [Rhopilema esculentum]|uniref:DNA polymerase delta subunit 4-like n=1 Tax=Rhopilema esculentum TaxID=499914 RepID=UPI0031DF2C9E